MRIALVIGNSKYESANSLPNAANDAMAVSKALKDLQFTVIGGTNLDKRAMEGKIREFNRMIGQAAAQPLALVFYAGHGVQVNGNNYLVPIDARLERTSDLELDGIDLDLVLRQMASQTTCVNLVLLDACRNDPFLARAFQSTRDVGNRATDLSFAPIRREKWPRETYIVFSTEPNAFAEDGTGTNSPFTNALLKNIFTPGLDFQIMMRSVRRDVTIATGQRQRPTEYGDITNSVIMLPNALSADSGTRGGIGGVLEPVVDRR